MGTTRALTLAWLSNTTGNFLTIVDPIPIVDSDILKNRFILCLYIFYYTSVLGIIISVHVQVQESTLLRECRFNSSLHI